jgi:hypothetical protein
MHDISRALWGRKGGYSCTEYAIAHLSSVHKLRRDMRELDLLVDVVHEEVESGSLNGIIHFKNNSIRDIENIGIELLAPDHPATITFYLRNGNEHAVKSDSTPFVHLGDLKTFESTSVTFLMKNISNGSSSLLFKVETEYTDPNYIYIRDFISVW